MRHFTLPKGSASLEDLPEQRNLWLMDFQMPLTGERVYPTSWGGEDHCEANTWGPTLPSGSWTFPHFWTHIFWGLLPIFSRIFYSKGNKVSCRGPEDCVHVLKPSLNSEADTLIDLCYDHFLQERESATLKLSRGYPRCLIWCQQFTHTKTPFPHLKSEGFGSAEFTWSFTTNIL